MALLSRVRRYIAEHQLAVPGTRVVVAVSGGSDSVALAHLVRELDAAGELRAVGLAHFNHQLRDSAGRDEAVSARLAESFGWRLSVGRGDVAALARRDRQSIEHAARAARHAFLEGARTELGADVIALGHTRDDQAETYLLRLLRGAGPKGLAGMHPRHGVFVRPLLSCRRQELRDYLAARGIGYVEDETNADVSIPRNRVRAELLPLLERRFNPQIVEVLADEAEMARETWLWLEEELKREAWSVKAEEGRGNSEEGRRMKEAEAACRELDVAQLQAAPPALRRFVVWRAMSEAALGRPVSFAHVQAALELVTSDAPRAIDVPGHTVERLGPRLVLRSSVPGAPRGASVPEPNFFDFPLSIPGEVPVPQAGCVLAAEQWAAGALDPGTLRVDSRTAVVRRDPGSGPWRVRNRRPGDRFRPVGVGGHKKLQDFFVDRKVARQRRDLVPLVVDEHDRIVWVAGHGIDEAFRVTDPAQAVLILRLKLLGGSA